VIRKLERYFLISFLLKSFFQNKNIFDTFKIKRHIVCKGIKIMKQKDTKFLMILTMFENKKRNNKF
jgi:hypothetical protein